MDRLQPTWLNENDDYILELLGESGVALNKRGIEVNLRLRDTPVSYSTIKRRVDKLEENGFVEDVGEEGSYFQLTDRGVAYLDGSPYGDYRPTDEWSVDTFSIEPIDYEILSSIAESESNPTEAELVDQINADSEYIRGRLTMLRGYSAIERNDEGFQLKMLGHTILTSFKRGKPVKENLDAKYRRESTDDDSQSSAE